MAERDPLAPLSTLVDAVSALIVAFALFAVVVSGLHLFGKADGAHMFSFSDDVCVETDSIIVDTGEELGTEPHTKPGSRTLSSGTTFCTKDPSWTMQLAASAGGILGTVLLLGACLIARRFIRIARREGIFTAGPARLMRALGWFLIAMAIIGPVGTNIGDGIFIASAAGPDLDQTWSSQVGSSTPDWSPLILGVCALTFSRVMRRGVSLQEEVALTI